MLPQNNSLPVVASMTATSEEKSHENNSTSTGPHSQVGDCYLLVPSTGPHSQVSGCYLSAPLTGPHSQVGDKYIQSAQGTGDLWQCLAGCAAPQGGVHCSSQEEYLIMLWLSANQSENYNNGER